jgi:hypothetical protein
MTTTNEIINQGHSIAPNLTREEYMNIEWIEKEKVREAMIKFKQSLYHLDTTGEFNPDNVIDLIDCFIEKELEL